MHNKNTKPTSHPPLRIELCLWILTILCPVFDHLQSVKKKQEYLSVHLPSNVGDSSAWVETTRKGFGRGPSSSPSVSRYWYYSLALFPDLLHFSFFSLHSVEVEERRKTWKAWEYLASGGHNVDVWGGEGAHLTNLCAINHRASFLLVESSTVNLVNGGIL